MKTNVFGTEVARVMRSAAARGEEADLERARNGWMFSLVMQISFRSFSIPLERSKP